MARKPASMYRRLKGPAYTRRKYIGGVPNNRILAFHSGNRRAAETGGFPVVLELRADNDCQIRHTALEAARVISNSTIRNAAGAQGYALRVHTYPHHVLRENKQATGAGADRVSQGMRCAFGKNVGTAARVRRGQRIISIHCHAGRSPQGRHEVPNSNNNTCRAWRRTSQGTCLNNPKIPSLDGLNKRMLIDDNVLERMR